MIIQKGTVKAIFHEQGLQITPDALPILDRQLNSIVVQFAIKKAAEGLKRLKAEDISLVNGANKPVGEQTGPKAGESTKPAVNSPRIEDNPSKIKGPCSRCAGIHDRVIRIARDLEDQINEGAKSVYDKKLRTFRG